MLLAALLLADAQNMVAQPFVPQPIGEPASWITADDYPLEALQTGLEGSVRVVLAIEEDGKVSGCTVLTSSGFAVLDEGTCAVLRARALFYPAEDRKGRPVRSTITRRVIWRLPHDLEPAVELGTQPYQRVLEIELLLDAKGKVIGCSLARQVNMPDSGASAYAGYPVGVAGYMPVLQHGKPVPVTVRIRQTIEVQPSP